MSFRYINPYTDFGFKKLFGEEANKDLLIDFLNAVLPDGICIAQLEFRNSERLPETITDRKARFDIACVSDKGESFIVEMQKAKQLHFKDRALFYASFPIQSQAQTGDWDFELCPVFLVAVLDFEYDEKEERRKLHRIISLRDQDGYDFSDKLRIIFLQMPLFTLKESELVTRKDKWLYFLKNLESFDDIPAIFREPIFEKAFNTAEYLMYPPVVKEAYQNDLKAYRDNKNTLTTARVEGNAEGEVKERIKIATKMKAKGFSLEDIADVTGMSIDEIKKLRVTKRTRKNKGE